MNKNNTSNQGNVWLYKWALDKEIKTIFMSVGREKKFHRKEKYITNASDFRAFSDFFFFLIAWPLLYAEGMHQENVLI